MGEETFFKLLTAVAMCLAQGGCIIAIALIWKCPVKGTPEEELSESLSAALKRGQPVSAEEYIRRK